MKYFLFLLICVLNLGTNAQTVTDMQYIIKGSVADSASQQPLDFVTVALRSGNNEPLKSVISGDNGIFLFSGIKAGKYLVNIISVGYKTRSIPVELDQRSELDLGVIYLAATNSQLKEVVVTAERPIIRQEVDRITYDLQADPESKSNNVMEMLRKVPMVTVDANDDIRLKGDANYRIFINGRPSSMMERNAKDVLKSMPASSIQNIEVITSPPAKYDAEGVAGIINIITNKKVDNGYNGSVNVSHRFPVGGPGTGGSFTVKQGKFGASGYGGASLSHNPALTRTISRTTSGSVASNLTQLNSMESDGRNAYFGGELSFEIDSLNLLSGQFNLNGNRSENNTFQSSVIDGQGNIFQSYDLDGNNRNRGGGNDLSFNYQRNFRKNKSRMLTLSYRYYGYRNRQRGDLLASNEVNYLIPDYNQYNNGGSSEQTFQLDYVHPVKKLTIEAGVKGIHRKNDSNFEFSSFNPATGQFELDPVRTNIFDNTQDVYSMYNSYQLNLKDWGFKAGFRIEQTIIDANFISTASQVEKSFLNIVPTININRKFKNMSSLNFAFMQRMQRPGIYQLNPFVDRSNPNFESTGNPDLYPAISNGINLGYSRSKKGSVNFVLGYQYFKDLIMPVSIFNPVTLITRNSYDNTGRARLFTANLNVNYPFTPKLSFSFNGGLAHGRVQGLVNNVLVKNEGLMSNFYTSLSYRFEKGWRANTSMNFNGPNLSIQGTSNSYIGSSFSVNKDIVKDKLSFSAAVNNPFSKYRTNIRESFGPDFLQVNNEMQFYRGFNTSLNYKFGKLKSSIRKNARGIRNDDVSNSAQ